MTGRLVATGVFFWVLCYAVKVEREWGLGNGMAIVGFALYRMFD